MTLSNININNISYIMVFWKTFPLLTFIKSKISNDKFTNLVFDREHFKSPTGNSVKLLSKINSTKILEIKLFLKNYFGNPPQTPTMDIPEDKLLCQNDMILYVEDIDNKIVGCIRYHYLGVYVTSDNQNIYCVDCFCIHPEWRRKGVGDYLLNELHIVANSLNIPYAFFLKEGKQLSVLNSPLYSGLYVYKKVLNTHSNNLQSLSIGEAYNLIDVFREFKNDIFIIRNKNNSNQIWRLYRKNNYKILACIQDTYQVFEKDRKKNKIGWITAWLESPNITDNYREEASKEISDSVYGIFDYIWANREWVGNLNDWQLDGAFHWYTYQWKTNISIKKSYCILN